MTDKENNHALTKPTEVGSTGLTQEEEAALTKDDRPAFIKEVHGVSDAAMKGIDGARPGDFMINGTKRIPAGSFGPGFRAVPIIARPRAVDLGATPVKSSHDPNSATWQELASRSNLPRGPKVGHEILMIMPDQKRLGIFFCANLERFNSGPKFLAAIKARQAVRVSTVITGAKQKVQITVEPIAALDPGDWGTGEKERGLIDAAVKAFTAYREEKPAPQGGRPR